MSSPWEVVQLDCLTINLQTIVHTLYSSYTITFCSNRKKTWIFEKFYYFL